MGAALRRAVFLLIEPRDASFRLWLEYEPRTNEWALPWRAGAGTCDALRLALRYQSGRVRFDRAPARRARIWRAVAPHSARPRSHQCIRERRCRFVSAPAIDGA